MKAFEFRPKLFETLKHYDKQTFVSDLMAGIIVGIVALPLAIAFGIASGVTPEQGIITATIKPYDGVLTAGNVTRAAVGTGNGLFEVAVSINNP